MDNLTPVIGAGGNNNLNNNLRSETIMIGENTLKPALEPEALLSTRATVNESLINSINSHKNKDKIAADDNNDELNPDDFELAIKTHHVPDDTDAKKKPKKPVTYAAKKTVAQGLIDIALITSNANQLKNLIDYNPDKSGAFYFILILILISLALQVSVGVSLIFKGRYDSKGKDKAAAARVNKYIMTGVFLITIINVFIAVFSTGPTPPKTNDTPPIPQSSQTTAVQ